MRKFIWLLLVLLVVTTPLVWADGLEVVIGVIQEKENNVITVNGHIYYPVNENMTLEEFSVGDKVKILYGSNPSGQRYYHAIVKPEESLPTLEVVPPA